jgi:deoxyxylulose-5-phosphate synthase
VKRLKLTDIKLSVGQFEHQLSKMRFAKSNHKTKYIENKRVPYFNKIFYKMLVENQQIPTQMDFWIEYLDYYQEDEVVKEIIETGHKAGLQGRAFRAYPSLIRDIHFALMLKSLGFQGVYHNNYQDSEQGVDVLLKVGKNKYAIHLYTDTKRGVGYRDIKHTKRDDITLEIEFPINLEHCKEIGNIKLYSTEYFVKLLVQIINFHGQE